MSTGWWLMIVWAAFDVGFLAGCAWVASRRPQPEVRTIYVPYHVKEQDEPEGFDWKAGVGVE